MSRMGVGWRAMMVYRISRRFMVWFLLIGVLSIALGSLGAYYFLATEVMGKLLIRGYLLSRGATLHQWLCWDL